MNKRYLVLIVTGAAFATFFAAGCAPHKRLPVTTIPVKVTSTVATQATTRPSTTEPTVIKDGKVYREFISQTTVKETAETTAKAAPTAKPTAKPTKKPTAKPTKKPTKKPTAKPTKKPTNKPVAKAAVNTKDTGKATPLAASPKNNANEQTTANKLTGIYNGTWSQITVDATDLNNVKLTVTIHNQDNADKTSVWKMSGKCNPDNGTIIYNNCTKTNFEYDGNGSVVSKNTAFNNGQGKVVISNGMLTWNDYQEHAADDMTFISANQHDHRG